MLLNTAVWQTYSCFIVRLTIFLWWTKRHCKFALQCVPVLIPPACTALHWIRHSVWKVQSLLSHSIILRRSQSQSLFLCSHFQTLNLLMKERIFIWNVDWNPWETQLCVWNGSAMADPSPLVSWKVFITETGFVIHKEWEFCGMISQNLLDNDTACVLHLGTPWFEPQLACSSLGRFVVFLSPSMPLP